MCCEIYDCATNQWTSGPLFVKDMTSNQLSTFQLRTMDDIYNTRICISGYSATNQRKNFIHNISVSSVAQDLTKYWFKQKAQELIFSVKEYINHPEMRRDSLSLSLCFNVDDTVDCFDEYKELCKKMDEFLHQIMIYDNRTTNSFNKQNRKFFNILYDNVHFTKECLCISMANRITYISLWMKDTDMMANQETQNIHYACSYVNSYLNAIQCELETADPSDVVVNNNKRIGASIQPPLNRDDDGSDYDYLQSSAALQS